MSQKIRKSEKELLMLAEPWMTHPTKVLAARLAALTARKHLDVHVRGSDLPVYSFTWVGFGVAQAAACDKGLPAIKIVQNDLVAEEENATEAARTSTASTTSATARKDVIIPQTTTQTIPVEVNQAIARPKGIVSVHRNGPVARNFATIAPRKRPAPSIEDTYQGLSQYTRAAAQDADESIAMPVSHRPINKRFAAPTVASVFHDKPTSVSEAHSDGTRNPFVMRKGIY